MDRMLAIAFMTAFIVTACEEKECPPVVQEDPCKYLDRQASSSVGNKDGLPRALDFDRDGEITNLDWAEWQDRCQ